MASEIKVDTISEKTSANGITIDGVNIKDSALATAGSVPLSTIDIDGGTDIGAAVVDADLFIIDDGAGGTNRKVTASRLKTYAGTTINNATANEIVTIGSTTTELDAEANLTFSGSALQCTATLTVGVDDTGHDVKFFGATASSYMLWDESADDLNLVASGLGVGTVGIKDLGTGIHVKVSDTGASATSNSDQLVLEKSGNSGLSILSSTSTSGLVSFGDSGDNDIGQLEYNHSDNSMRFGVNAAERARIINDGSLLVNRTAQHGSYAGQLSVLDSSTTSGRAVGLFESTAASSLDTSLVRVLSAQDTTNSSYNLFDGHAPSGRFLVRDSANVENTNNSYGAISDERIKQDITDANSQWNDIKALKIRNFKLKTNTSKTQLGVVAQELEASGMNGLVEDAPPEKEDVALHSDFGTIDDDGNFTKGQRVKSVKYSVLYMKAIKALQEAQTRIETLETKVTALEG
jgi:hypothetical protein